LRATTGLLYALTIGAATGLGLTWWTLVGGPEFGALRIGPWTAWPQAGTQEADRYVRASVARSGDLPLGSGEGIAFIATRDSNAAPLDGRCRYRVAPIVPPSRWWTLALYDARKRLVANPAQRYGFTSSQVLRSGDGVAEVAIGPQVLPGNWLPSPQEAFILVLRLYDSPISGSLASKETVALPDIVREACL
jgi:hypothetical protein